MKFTGMNLRNRLTEKDIGWVNLPQLILNISLDSHSLPPAHHSYILSVSLIPLLELSKTIS